MKKTLQTLALILWVVGSSFGQCPNTNLYTFCPALDASNLVLGTITPVCVMVAGDYQIINNIVAGNTYRISFCNAIGSDNPPTAHDSFMTVYGPGGFVVFNDNHCGTNSQVEFVAPSSGTYRVLCNVSGNCSASNFVLTPTTITLVNAPSSALTVSSINRANTSPSNSSVVNYTVTFSGDVSGLVASNFTLSTTGAITGASVGTPTGSGNTWTVPVNTGSGDGTLRLDLANAMGLSPTVTTPYNSGQIYDIDKTPPTVSIGAPSVSSTTCGPVTYTITYSGATSISLTNANVSVNAPGTFVVNVAVSGTGTNTRTVTLSGISGNGVVGITIAPNTATDAAGNAAASATTGSNNTFSVTAPSAGINPSSTSVCVGAQVSLNGTGSGTYSWSAIGGGFTSNSSNPTAWSASTPGNYTVSLTAGSGTCTASATQVITVNANPTLSVTPPATQCGGSINLSTVFSSNGSLTYFTENTFTNTAANPVMASGTYYARAELNGCTATASVAVTINPLPTLSVTPPSVACGGSVDLSTVFSTSGTLSYFTENTFTNIAANPVTASGTYYARAELNGCTATASVAVTINPNPTLSVTPPAAQCGGSINLNTVFSSNGSLTYFTENTFTNTAANPVMASGTYYARAELNGCTATASVAVTINPLPTLSVTPPSVACGGSVDLSTVFSTSGTLSYFTENTFTNTAANPVTASGTYYARAELNGCTATASVNITINTSATISVNAPPSQCGGGINLSTVFSTNGTLSYFTENTFTNTAANPVMASGTYYARAELNGCTATASVAVSILSNPPVQVVSNSPACAGTTLNLSALGGTSWTWSGPASFTSNVQYPNRPVLSGNMSGTYSVTISTANGCTQVATTRVVVNPVVSGEVSSNSPICVGNTLRLSASGGSSYTWSGPGFGSSVQNPTRTGGTAAIAGAYSVTVSGACGSASLTTPVVVSANIAPSIVSIQVNGQMPNAQNTVSVCNTQGISLTVAATNTAMYSWRGPTGAGSGFESSTASPVTMPVASPRTGQYTVTARNGCTVFNHRVVNIQLIGCSNRLAAELPDPSRMGLSVAPNPVTEQLTIQMLQQRTTSVRVSVVDALGREMYAHDLKPEETSVQVSVKAWPTGWYVVSAEAEGYREYAKIIKQ